jgi:hypothetical protein
MGPADWRARWRQWLEMVSDTQAEEISCSECLDRVSDYVDLEIAGAAETEPALKQHLRQCRACRDEYEVLRELARLEAEGRPPDIDDLRRGL